MARERVERTNPASVKKDKGEWEKEEQKQRKKSLDSFIPKAVRGKAE